MERPYLLHMFTPTKNVSPFDVNMAYDAGWTAAIPYTHVDTNDIPALVQDAIFSRGPKGVKRTGIFLGGRDMHIAMDMLEAARSAMVPPFEVSVFADPSGAFTTAAGLIAAVERQLIKAQNTKLDGLELLILGGTGPVGAVAAVIAAKAGAKVTILSRKITKAKQVAQLCNHRYGADVIGIRGDVNDQLDELIKASAVVLATAKAGIEVLSANHIATAEKLKVAADVNAVPPAGIAGVDMRDDGVQIPGTVSGAVGIGALAIGNVKYQTQRQLLEQMRNADSPHYFHFEHAFEFARDYVKD